MSTREKLLALLNEHPGVYFSGEEMAAGLQVSRTAVWKAVKSLQAQGYAIHAVTNRGYCLSPDTDLLSESGICPGSPLWQIHVTGEVSSTNSLVRDLANQGAPEGYVLAASAQTEGRGRMGRQFFSPRDTGIYLSLLLRPTGLMPSQALQITTMAAAALVTAIEKVTGLSPEIKWVNDLYFRGKKICGILTEASFNLESGTLDYAVLGLGLNVYPPECGFPEGLQSSAGWLLDHRESGLKNRLITGFLEEFSGFYENRAFAAAAQVYRQHSLLPGKQVLVEGKTARVLDITDSCQLVVQYPDGGIRTLSYGEVSIVNL